MRRRHGMIEAIAVVAVMTVAIPLGAGASAAASAGAGAIPGAHDCVPRRAADRDGARVAWKRLQNPVFVLDHMVKDQTIRLVDGKWHLFFSERTGPGDEAERSGHWVSTDLARWRPVGARGRWDSPDLTRGRDGRYVLTHQEADPAAPDLPRVVASTARRPNGPWSEPARLAPGIFEDQRLIDGALAHTDHGLFLLFKRGARDSVEQHDELAYAASGSLDGPWEYVGEPDLPWSENFEFLLVDGTWHVLVTRIPLHAPVLFRLAGDPADPQAWLHWEEVRVLEVPEESWNQGESPGVTHETANSAYLCDARRLDGHWYLLYAGSTELDAFEGRGHAKLGVARSTDLVNWDVP